MKPKPDVLAQAENPSLYGAKPNEGKVIAVTSGTSNWGEQICHQAALSGASVFAIDKDPVALAKLVISFRQNKLSLRGIPCEISAEESLYTAIDEITSHAPPIDLWIHAAPLNAVDLNALQPALKIFGQHFALRGKGMVGLLKSSLAFSIAEKESILSGMRGLSSSDVVAINLINSDDKSAPTAAVQLLQRGFQTAGIYEYTEEG